jgi:glutamate synthase (NADPH/NADH)
MQTSHRGWTTRTVDCTFAVSDGPDGLKAALQRVCLEADAAVKDKCSLLVLSDRAMGPDRVAIPSLLSVGAAHSYLVKTMQRTQIGLLLETGEAREVHHMCTLVGYGADGICPYLAIESLEALQVC